MPTKLSQNICKSFKICRTSMIKYILFSSPYVAHTFYIITSICLCVICAYITPAKYALHLHVSSPFVQSERSHWPSLSPTQHTPQLTGHNAIHNKWKQRKTNMCLSSRCWTCVVNKLLMLSCCCLADFDVQSACKMHFPPATQYASSPYMYIYTLTHSSCPI